MRAQAFGPHWHGCACWQQQAHEDFAAAGVWHPQVQLAPMQSGQVQADFIALSVFMVDLRGRAGRAWPAGHPGRPLARTLERKGYPPPVVFHLDVPKDVVVNRITARRQCPTCNRIYNVQYQPPKTDGICDFDGATLFTRKDDNEETVRERLRAYDQLTDPVIQHYRTGNYHKFDGTRSPEHVFEAIAEVLQNDTVASIR